MNRLPNEVIENILHYTRQNYKSVLSTVCKKWNDILSQPFFLKTLHLYSIQQLKKCIQLTKEKTINGLTICDYAEHIYIHFYVDMYRNEEIIIDMLATFSNIHAIHGVFPLACYFTYTIPLLNQLDHFSLWYNVYEDEEWVDLFSNNQQKIKLLEFKLKEEFLISSPPSSSLSIPYYTPTSSIKIINEDYEMDMMREYKINNIILPLLPSLTSLLIDCLEIDCNESIFESIHQSCPQLISLTLKSFKMHISGDYANHLSSSMQPNLKLRELSIGDQFYDSQCYDYLSMKYPLLTSLSLNLSSRYYLTDTFAIFRLAIYNMITQYKCLKRLMMDVNYDEYLYQVWPYVELCKWLQQNTTKLSHLSYNYDYVIELLIDNGYLEQEQEHHLMNTSIISSSLTSTLNNYNNVLFGQHNYLNHLSSLSIRKDINNSIFILYYFYLCNENSIFLSNSIETLSIDSSYFGNIYFCLNAFPNLKSLRVSGYSPRMEINDDEEFNEYSDYNSRYHNVSHLKNVFQFFKKKMKLQQAYHYHKLLTTAKLSINDINDDDDNNNNVIHYKLKKIELKNSNVYFKINGWNGFFKRCPQLKEIILCNINTVKQRFASEPIKRPISQATFDLSHLSLDLLKIDNFNYEPILLEYYQYHFVKVLMVKEISLSKFYYLGFESKCKDITFNYSNSTTLNIVCKYVDNIIFNHDKY